MTGVASNDGNGDDIVSPEWWLLQTRRMTMVIIVKARRVLRYLIDRVMTNDGSSDWYE